MDRRKFLKIAGLSAGTTIVAGCAASGWRAQQVGLIAQDTSPFAPWDALDSLKVNDSTALAAAAILASNPHNTQPWRLVIDDKKFQISADPDRNLGAFDPYRREMWIGLGAAIANAEIVAPKVGFNAGKPKLTRLGSDGAGTIEISLDQINPTASPLEPLIAKRRTNRAPYEDDHITSEVLARVSDMVGEIQNANYLTFHRNSKIGAAFATKTVEATRTIIADHEMSEDGHQWYRSNAREVAKYRDGVSIPTAGLSPAISLLGQILPSADAQTSGEYWLASTEKQVRYTGGFGLILVDDLYSKDQQIAAGRLWQRLHLALTAEGIAAHPMNQLPELVDRDRDLGKDRGWKESLNSISGPSGHATFAFRFGIPIREVPHSARRPLEWVMEE